MPFKSQAQARFLFLKHPKVAKEFAAHTPSIKNLPQHVKTHKTMETKPKMSEHPHPFKHTHAHHANTMQHMVEHMPHKLSVAHPAHPANKHFKEATENVQHAGGHTGKMEVKGV